MSIRLPGACLLLECTWQTFLGGLIVLILIVHNDAVDKQQA